MKKLILIVAFSMTTSMTFCQASFDPVANDKLVAERRAKEKALKEKEVARLKENLPLPKPYQLKKINNSYSKEFYINEDIFKDYDIRINKINVSQMYEKEYVENFDYMHDKSFTSEDDKQIQNELAKKHYLGATILKSLNDSIAFDYIKLIDIPETDVFKYIGDKSIEPDYYIEKYVPKYNYDYSSIDNKFIGKEDHYNNDEKYYIVSGGQNNKKIVIQNTITNLYYILNGEATAENHGSYDDRTILKYLKKAPKPISASELLNLKQYKELIKNATTNANICASIQKKHLTRGYFDERKVQGVDKQTYNKNLVALKEKRKKILKLSRDANDNVIDYKITDDELALLINLDNWSNYYPIN